MHRVITESSSESSSESSQSHHNSQIHPESSQSLKENQQNQQSQRCATYISDVVFARSTCKENLLESQCWQVDHNGDEEENLGKNYACYGCIFCNVVKYIINVYSIISFCNVTTSRFTSTLLTQSPNQQGVDLSDKASSTFKIS